VKFGWLGGGSRVYVAAMGMPSDILQMLQSFVEQGLPCERVIRCGLCSHGSGDEAWPDLLWGTTDKAREAQSGTICVLLCGAS